MFLLSLEANIPSVKYVFREHFWLFFRGFFYGFSERLYPSPNNDVYINTPLRAQRVFNAGKVLPFCFVPFVSRRLPRAAPVFGVIDRGLCVYHIRPLLCRPYLFGVGFERTPSTAPDGCVKIALRKTIMTSIHV